MKKIAFVFSGGGLRGCFQVGALNYLIKEKKILPDIVCGISTGSLQAISTAQNDLDLLNQLWLGIKKTSDVYTGSINTIISSAFWGKGIYRFDGLAKIIRRAFDKKRLLASETEFFIGTADLQSSKLSYHSKEKLTLGKILASCTIPVLFSPVNIGGKQLVDGGIRHIVPLQKSIDEKATDIYVILCAPLNIRKINRKFRDTRSILMRTMEIMENEFIKADIQTALKTRKLAQHYIHLPNKYHYLNVHIISPSKHFIDILEVNHEKIKKGINHGWKRAKEIVS